MADSVLEKDILEALAPLRLPILSEESGYVAGDNDSQYRFIVDPLDGTFNFVKGLGPSAVSIALWKADAPIFGVIYSIGEQQLFWGGASLAAYGGGRRISVSHTSTQAEAAICTGLPVRFDVSNEAVMRDFGRMIAPFAKVRMLGSAAMSLVAVARGAADAYCEHNIMLWDVAAGLAIVEGAGGAVTVKPSDTNEGYTVCASNGRIVF